MGLLVTDLKREYSRTLVQRGDTLDAVAVEDVFARLEAQGHGELRREGTHPRDMVFTRQVELRYVGQSYELSVAVPRAALTPHAVGDMLRSFHREHDRAYGYSAPNEPVELVTLRVSAVGRIAKPRLRELPAGGADSAAARKAARQVYFAENGGRLSCPVYDRYRFCAGQVIPGPAICEEYDSTTVIHPGYRAGVDRFGNLLLTRS
jgi:N-methylhydantoinase A